MFGNGEKRYEKDSEALQPIGETLNHVAVGLLYWPFWYLSMYGRVTDLQVFGKILSKKMMEKVRGCQERIGGYLILSTGIIQYG